MLKKLFMMTVLLSVLASCADMGLTGGDTDPSGSVATTTTTTTTIAYGPDLETTAWTASLQEFTGARYYFGSAVYNGYIYISGGEPSASNYLQDVQYCKINTDGTLSSWFTAVQLPVLLKNHRMIAHNGYLYVIGGFKKIAAAESYSAYVYYNTINADGSLGDSWTQTTDLAVATAGHDVQIYKNQLWVFGGHTGSYTDKIYKADINTDGTVGTFSETGTLPSVCQYLRTMIYRDTLYVFGGLSPAVQGTSYAGISPSGTLSAWIAGTAAYGSSGTMNRTYHSLIGANGYVYLLGGGNGATTADVLFSRLYPDGNGGWAPAKFLSVATQKHESVIWNQRIYVLGGANSGGTAVNDTYFIKLRQNF